MPPRRSGSESYFSQYSGGVSRAPATLMQCRTTRRVRNRSDSYSPSRKC